MPLRCGSLWCVVAGALGPASLALSALRFFDWLVGQGELSANPARGLPRRKFPATRQKNIDVDDANRLLDIDLTDPLAVRDRAMLGGDVRRGIARSELVNFLDIKHLDLESGEVWVMRAARASFADRSCNAVAWIEHRAICAACSVPTTTLFLSKLGKRISARKRTEARFAEWGITGLNSRVHPHKLRHSLADPYAGVERLVLAAAAGAC